MKDITERLAKVGERVRIPCPDGIKGCAVFHFRVLTDPVCLEAIVEIERLREALRDCHHVLHKLMAIVPGNDTAVDEMAKVMTKARAALGEGK